MADEPRQTEPEGEDAEAGEKERSVLGTFVKRAINSGIEAATRSKEDIVRVATNEMRTWLDRMDVQSEIAKALTKLVVEVKAEIRFRPKEGGGIEPEITSDIKTQPPQK